MTPGRTGAGRVPSVAWIDGARASASTRPERHPLRPGRGVGARIGGGDGHPGLPDREYQGLAITVLAMGSARLARAIHNNHAERAVAARLPIELGAWTRAEGSVFGVALGVAGIEILVMRSQVRVPIGPTIPFLTIGWAGLTDVAKDQLCDEAGTGLRASAGRWPGKGVR